jgi:hypothetical protein
MLHWRHALPPLSSIVPHQTRYDNLFFAAMPPFFHIVTPAPVFVNTFFA